jgi:signal transduction histidine kinase
VESRVLIYAPTGKDARLIAQILERAEMHSFVCLRSSEIAEELKNGVGALLLVDEALTASLLRQLTDFLIDQPSWSDLPILVLSRRGLDSPELRKNYFQLGNVTLLERPLQSVTLLSATKSALRARRRQYAMREIDRRKDEFLAMLAHELRNPLAPISAASALLKIPHLDREKIKQTSEIISRQVKHMSGLIDDLLDVSRVSRGLVTLTQDILDAKQILISAVEQVRPLIDARQHRLTLQTPDEQVYLKGDPKRLVQIIANVLNNAAKYTTELGEIILRMDANSQNVKFTVSDNGIGIAPDVIDHIFEMFSQAERTSDRTQGGLGIGLALVKNLVHLHGGTVKDWEKEVNFN